MATARTTIPLDKITWGDLSQGLKALLISLTAIAVFALFYCWMVSRTTGQTLRGQTKAIEGRFNQGIAESDPNKADFDVIYNPIDIGWGTVLTLGVIIVLILFCVVALKIARWGTRVLAAANATSSLPPTAGTTPGPTVGPTPAPGTSATT